MLTFLKSLFFKKRTSLKLKELEDKICVIEESMQEITAALQNQATLIAVIAGIQRDLVSFLGGHPEPLKSSHKDSKDPLASFTPDDDEFIN